MHTKRGPTCSARLRRETKVCPLLLPARSKQSCKDEDEDDGNKVLVMRKQKSQSIGSNIAEGDAAQDGNQGGHQETPIKQEVPIMAIGDNAEREAATAAGTETGMATATAAAAREAAALQAGTQGGAAVATASAAREAAATVAGAQAGIAAAEAAAAREAAAAAAGTLAGTAAGQAAGAATATAAAAAAQAAMAGGMLLGVLVGLLIGMGLHHNR
jgi:hypothetical protein